METRSEMMQRVGAEAVKSACLDYVADAKKRKGIVDCSGDGPPVVRDLPPMLSAARLLAAAAEEATRTFGLESKVPMLAGERGVIQRLAKALAAWGEVAQ